MLANIDRARDALQAIPPDLPRDDWVKTAMAVQAAGLSFDDFDAWSAGGGNYDQRAARDLWRSIKPGEGITEATLYRMAAEHGDYGKQRQRPAKAPRKPVERAKPPRPGMGAPEVWARCEAATRAHGYIMAKGGRTDGLRVVPAGDPLTVAGLSMAGALVVPVVPFGGAEPAALQFIAPPEAAQVWKDAGRPSKLNLPGATLSGGFIVGDMVAGGTAYLCEGIATAWACWQATGCAAVVCFGWGQVGKVAAELRQRDASARLVLVPDAGKEAEAEAIAREVAGEFVEMPEGSPTNFDANDYGQREGLDALEVLLSKARGPAQRFRLLGSEELRGLPPLAWWVRGVLPAQGLASIYGPSASGKSFLALDLTATGADGGAWFGYRVKPRPVVYCALEGEAGFRLRVAAWEHANGRTLPAGLRLVLQPFKLTEPQDVTDLAAAVLTAGRGAVVVLDTLNRAAPEADENASSDMGCILEAAKHLQRLTDGLVVLVHHTGKDATKGLRGHSSLFAALDAAVEVTREGERREWKVAKAKDGQDGAGHPFALDVVDLGTDDEGEAVTSCVVVPDEAPQDKTRSRLPKGGNQKVVLDALGDLLRKSATFGKAGAPPQRPCIEQEAAVDGIAPRLVVESHRRKERTWQALRGLAGNGVVVSRDGWLWLP